MKLHVYFTSCRTQKLTEHIDRSTKKKTKCANKVGIWAYVIFYKRDGKVDEKLANKDITEVTLVALKK